MSRSISTAIQAARQLGIHSLYDYARYQVGLSSGYYRRKSTRPDPGSPVPIQPLLQVPTRQALLETLGDSTRVLTGQADEVVQGKVRLFGDQPVPLQLVPPGKLFHWTAYERGKHSFGVEDVKTIWEPARFGWAFTLGRAYILTGDERYAHAFWEHAETFLNANPAYLGPNWFSGQEAALRLFAFTFAGQVFSLSPHSTPSRTQRLSQAIAIHAARIPLTLVYAKAQDNNHLLTEAAGLYTAGLALPEHPRAAEWRSLGWRTFNKALESQVTAEGAYIQHSTNYHRLMLQTLLWVNSLTKSGDLVQPLPYTSRLRGAAATGWLMSMLDPTSGGVPNLGPNDGAYILPFTTCPFEDFRPVLQAAASTFLGQRPFPSGPVDEMALWLVPGTSPGNPLETGHLSEHTTPVEPHILSSSEPGSWAYLRLAHFTSRPGHADQLHLDLWWEGKNIALDPGTYQYNAQAPWDNSLARTEVHNTVSINGRDQMKRAGRFLWLDWAQGHILDYQLGQDGSLHSLTAQHDGYCSAGLLHRRRVSKQDRGWQVQDDLLPFEKPALPESVFQARLHWLLPDWPWQIIDDGREDSTGILYTLGIQSVQGPVELKVRVSAEDSPHGSLRSRMQIVRAGELLYGTGDISPTWGWCSPTYNHLIPAISFSIMLNCRLPAQFASEWVFPSTGAAD